MLQEIYEYLTTPCQSQFKNLGYLKESIAISARYKRVQSAWDEHLQNSRSFIIETAKAVSDHHHLLILGSGALIDIPIYELSRIFNKITLVDVVHPKSARSLSKKLSNLEFLEEDVTGVGAGLDRVSSVNYLPAARQDCPGLREGSSMIISAGLLSQLPAVLKNYINKHHNFPEKELDAWFKALIQAHLSMLSDAAPPACLITDLKRTFYDNNAKLEWDESALFDVSMPDPDRSWQWDIAPRGEINGGFLVNSVNAYRDFKLS